MDSAGRLKVASIHNSSRISLLELEANARLAAGPEIEALKQSAELFESYSVKFFACKDGLNFENYTDMKILRREREALCEDKTHAEFARKLLNEKVIRKHV